MLNAATDNAWVKRTRAELRKGVMVGGRTEVVPGQGGKAQAGFGFARLIVSNGVDVLRASVFKCLPQ